MFTRELRLTHFDGITLTYQGSSGISFEEKAPKFLIDTIIQVNREVFAEDGNIPAKITVEIKDGL